MIFCPFLTNKKWNYVQNCKNIKFLYHHHNSKLLGRVPLLWNLWTQTHFVLETWPQSTLWLLIHLAHAPPLNHSTGRTILYQRIASASSDREKMKQPKHKGRGKVRKKPRRKKAFFYFCQFIWKLCIVVTNKCFVCYVFSKNLCTDLLCFVSHLFPLQRL